MKVTEKIFGTLSDGSEVKLYTISNENMSFSCTDYGCTLTSIVVGKEKKTDVLLGFSTLEGWLNTKFCFGAVVVRFANRIGKASFDLNGKTYQLDKNDGPNTLHGGFEGYDKMLWSSKVVQNENSAGVTFTRLSPDGEQGFPGNLELSVTYLLDENNNLNCIYNAKSDKTYSGIAYKGATNYPDTESSFCLVTFFSAYTDNFGVQFAHTDISDIYSRSVQNGIWTNWKKLNN